MTSQSSGFSGSPSGLPALRRSCLIPRRCHSVSFVRSGSDTRPILRARTGCPVFAAPEKFGKSCVVSPATWHELLRVRACHGATEHATAPAPGGLAVVNDPADRNVTGARQGHSWPHGRTGSGRRPAHGLSVVTGLSHLRNNPNSRRAVISVSQRRDSLPPLRQESREAAALEARTRPGLRAFYTPIPAATCLA
jgi:hypothetical protein